MPGSLACRHPLGSRRKMPDAARHRWISSWEVSVTSTRHAVVATHGPPKTREMGFWGGGGWIRQHGWGPIDIAPFAAAMICRPSARGNAVAAVCLPGR
ncbi:hypothetical protein ACLOJK_029795 [Asimina triloba]